MPYLSIAGITVEVQSKGGASLTYEAIGGVVRTYSGLLRSQVRARKRIWQGDTPPLTDDDASTLTAGIGLGLVTLAGDWPGGSVNCFVEITNDVPIKSDGSEFGHLRILTIKATEV